MLTKTKKKPTSKKRNNKITADLLLDLTLEMIDEHQGSKGVNLREIAKRAGCAHTNIYNYFRNLDELIWHALAKSYKLLGQYTIKKIGPEYNASQFFMRLIESQIDFALEHPGLHRFMWLEPTHGSPPKSVMKYWNKFMQDFILMIFALSDKKLSQSQCETIAEIIIGYIHGEIPNLLQNIRESKKNNKREKIRKNSQTLLYSLIEYYQK